MYQPILHRENERAAQHALMRAHPLALLITNGPGGLIANSVPFLLYDEGEHGVLRAHVARANPQWREADGEHEALVVFQGLDHYITPSFYATKQETGAVVPTWNYVMVQAHGPMRAIEDTAWIHAQVDALTNQHEAQRTKPWAVSDAPERFMAQQLKAIVGIEIPITRIDGKWKVSQNRTAADRAGVIAGLREDDAPDAQAMADLVEKARNP